MIEGIILEEGSSIHEVLEFLEKNKTSRTVFLPKWWKVKPYARLGENLNALPAAELVKGNDEYAQVIRNILSATLIASNRRAEKFYSTPQGIKVVTLKGEVFDNRGTIPAGIESGKKTLAQTRRKY
jgi:chromosome segregation ATPase